MHTARVALALVGLLSLTACANSPSYDIQSGKVAVECPKSTVGVVTVPLHTRFRCDVDGYVRFRR